MRRALLLVGLLAPALAQAQAISPGTINFAPTAIGVSACGSAATDNLTLTFSLQPTGVVTSGTYTVLATTAATTTTTGAVNPITVCPSSAGTVASVTASANAPQSINVGAAKVVSAAGLQCSDTSTPTINVCVHYTASGSSTVTASAIGTITLETQPPSAPWIWLVEPANHALFVHWNPGGGGAASTSYQIVAEPNDGTGAVTSGKINSVAQNVDARIEGLKNGVLYSVKVIPFSDAGDRGSDSNIVTATPVETAGFWDRYQGAGGKEQGGCASGPAGLGALLLAAGGLARLRRRS